MSERKVIHVEIDSDLFYKVKQKCLDSRLTIKEYVCNVISRDLTGQAPSLSFEETLQQAHAMLLRAHKGTTQVPGETSAVVDNEEEPLTPEECERRMHASNAREYETAEMQRKLGVK